MMAMVLAVLLSQTQAELDQAAAVGPCTKRLMTALTEAKGITGTECRPELSRLVDNEVSVFLQGGDSLIGDFFQEMETQGKLAAVLLRLKRLKPYRTTDGYQKAKWGMTPKQVQKLYPSAKPNGPRWLGLSGQVAGKASVTAFEFADDRLVRVMVVLNEHYMNPNNHLADYQMLKKLLTDKYGEPDSDDADWSQSLYQDVPEHWGTALVMGHVRLNVGWTVGDTRIQLRAHGEQVKAHVGVVYSSSALAELLEEANKTEQLQDL